MNKAYNKLFLDCDVKPNDSLHIFVFKDKSAHVDVFIDENLKQTISLSIEDVVKLRGYLNEILD